MNMDTPRSAIPARRIALLAAALCLCAGCGSGPDDTTNAGPTDDGPPAALQLEPRLNPSGPTGPRAQAAEPIRDAQEGLATGSGQSVCFELTHDLEERVMRSTGTLRACADVVDEAITQLHANGTPPELSQIEHIALHGDTATITVNDPARGTYDVEVIKHPRWELPRLDLTHPSGLVPAE